MGGILLTQYTGTWPQDVGALIVCDSRPVYSAEAADVLQQMGRRASREYAPLEDYMAHFRIHPDGLRAPQEVHRYIACSAALHLPSGMWTHKIEGLTRSDFIMAAKTDQIAAQFAEQE